MKILAYQGLPAFCDKAKNLATIENVCASAATLGVDVAVFPELFITGYNLGERTADLAEHLDGEAMIRLREIAAHSGVAIITGFPESSGGNTYNAAIAISANGKIVGRHHKVFLYGSQEKQLFTPGDSFTVFELAGHTCALSICYDVEFPEAGREMIRQGAEILFNPTANMAPYYEVPTTLVRARALENGMAVIYANLCGHEEELKYTGLSAIVAPDGTDLARAGADTTILMADLAPALKRNRTLPLSNQLNDLRLWYSRQQKTLPPAP